MMDENSIISASDLTILSANVNGLGDKNKRAEFLNHIDKANADIVCLVDTRFSEASHDLIRNETNFNCFFNSLNSNSRGVSVLVSKKCPIKINVEFNDNSGNILWLKCTIQDEEFLLCVIYGPNEDDPDFFTNIFHFYEQCGITNCIIAGDFNVTLDHSKDNYGYANPRSPRSRLVLNNLIQNYNFFDSYRYLHNEKNLYTWIRKGGPQRSRLDMFIVSESLKPYLTKHDKLTSYKSDHLPIILKIDFAKFSRGRGTWKHNSSLLRDPNYVSRINKTIKTTCAKYVQLNNYENFLQDSSAEEFENFMNLEYIDLQKLDYSINPHLLLEMFLNDIRNETISYTTAKNKAENEVANNLLSVVKNLQNKLACSNDIANNTLTEELETAEKNYNDFIESKTCNLSFKSKSLNRVEGEKPTKFFCALEKNHNAQRFISKLVILDKDNNEVLIKDQKLIDGEARSYYKNLYDNKDSLITKQLDDFIEIDSQYNKLTPEQSDPIEGDITLEELTSILRKTRNDSSPGSTGFTYAFYKTFWNQLGGFILDAANHSFVINKLPSSQTIGLISLLPKGDKPKEYLSNWRPITLQNSIYKLISGVISKRINGVLPHLIHSDQSGFVNGRYIGDCVRNTFDILEWAKRNKKTGLLLLIDFEKAFDCISFKFIEKTMKFFGFGPDSIKWTNILLNNFRASINHAGNISLPFNILRGCRQGDPIASALFIMSIEILCIKLRNSKNVRGFKISNLEVLLSLYADDCSIFLEYDSNNLYAVINILNEFYSVSGLKIQMQKTQCIVFGRIPAANYKLCEDLNLKWEQNFKLLGVEFDGMLSNMDKNFDIKMREINDVISAWQYRFISPIGRACVTKTLLLSKLSHLAFVIPAINKQRLKNIESLLYNFIWGGKEKVSRNDAKQPETRGGLGFPDIQSSWLSYKFSWFRRLAKSTSAWKKIFELNLETIGINLNMFYTTLGISEYKKISKVFPNSFWSECLNAVKPLMLEHLKNVPENILSYPIWGSTVFIKATAICERNQFGNIGSNITYPYEILKDSDSVLTFLTAEEFTQRFNEPPNFLHYTSLKLVITYAVQRLGLNLGRMTFSLPMQPPLISLINYSLKGCTRWTKMLKNLSFNNKSLLERERKWENCLGALQGISFWEKCYSMTREIFFDNKIKWLQYQIVRGTLKTNRIVSKFIPGINESCTFCNLETETILHLFYDCNISLSFLKQVYLYFIQKWPNIQSFPTRKEFIFGIKTKKSFEQENLFELYLKFFIWRTRCLKGNLSLEAFINWFRIELKINHLAYGQDKRLRYLDIDSNRLEILPVL